MDLEKSKIIGVLLHVLYIGFLFMDFMIVLDLMVKPFNDFNMMDLNIVSFLFVIFFIVISVIGMLIVLYLFFKELKDFYRHIRKLIKL